MQPRTIERPEIGATPRKGLSLTLLARRYAWVWTFGLIVGFVFLVYGSSLNYGMYLDDNHHVRPWGLGEVLGTFAGPFDPLRIEPPYFRPITVTTFGLDWLVWGYDSAGYRLTNVVLYALATGLVCLLVYRLSASYFLALSSALVFVLVPANASTAVYISERSDALVVIFVAAGMLSYQAYLRSSKLVWLGAALLSEGLAFGSKEIGTSLPLLFVFYLLYQAWLKSANSSLPATSLSGRVLGRLRATWATLDVKDNWKNLLVSAGLPLGVLAGLLLYRQLILPSAGTSEQYDPKGNLLSAYISAVFQTFKAVPWEVAPWVAVLPGVGLGVAVLVNRYSLTWRWFGFGLGWLLIACLPLAPLGGKIEPRLLFLPTVGYAICVAAILALLLEASLSERSNRNGWLKRGLLVLFVVLLFGVSGWDNRLAQYQYSPFSPKTLYQNGLLYNDPAMRARYPEHNIKLIEQELQQAGELPVSP